MPCAYYVRPEKPVFLLDDGLFSRNQDFFLRHSSHPAAQVSRSSRSSAG